jgi:hypothetical protein
MVAFRLLFLTLALSGAALAQDGERGSIPPGQSRDGAAPADGAIQGGAIKGGAILPGESMGEPDRAKQEKRCAELSGALREECLKRIRDSRTRR